LEYEEVLKKKLPAERWGWAAIHLCNLYTRLGKSDNAKALLERLAKDYSKTTAARKARQKLGLPEPEEGVTAAAPEPEPSSAQHVGETAEVFDLDKVMADEEEGPPLPSANDPPAKSRQLPEPSEGSSGPKLPPGFRRKQ
jgi:hypothetical protein